MVKANTASEAVWECSAFPMEHKLGRQARIATKSEPQTGTIGSLKIIQDRAENTKMQFTINGFVPNDTRWSHIYIVRKDYYQQPYIFQRYKATEFAGGTWEWSNLGPIYDDWFPNGRANRKVSDSATAIEVNVVILAENDSQWVSTYYTRDGELGGDLYAETRIAPQTDPLYKNEGGVYYENEKLSIMPCANVTARDDFIGMRIIGPFSEGIEVLTGEAGGNFVETYRNNDILEVLLTGGPFVIRGYHLTGQSSPNYHFEISGSTIQKPADVIIKSYIRGKEVIEPYFSKSGYFNFATTGDWVRKQDWISNNPQLMSMTHSFPPDSKISFQEVLDFRGVTHIVDSNDQSLNPIDNDQINKFRRLQHLVPAMQHLDAPGGAAAGTLSREAIWNVRNRFLLTPDVEPGNYVNWMIGVLWLAHGLQFIYIFMSQQEYQAEATSGASWGLELFDAGGIQKRLDPAKRTPRVHSLISGFGAQYLGSSDGLDIGSGELRRSQWEVLPTDPSSNFTAEVQNNQIKIHKDTVTGYGPAGSSAPGFSGSGNDWAFIIIRT